MASPSNPSHFATLLARVDEHEKLVENQAASLLALAEQEKQLMVALEAAQLQRDRMHSAVLHEEAQAMCAQRDAIEARLSAADAKTKAEAAESKATVAIAQAANAKLALEATKRRCARTTAAHEHWERTELQPQADAWVAAAQQRHDASIAGGGGSGVGARTGLQALRDKHGELKRAEAVAQSKLDEVRGRVQAEVDRREAQAESVQAEQGIAAAKRRQAELRRLVAVAKQRESNLETLLQERETAATNLSRRCSELEGRIQHHVDRALHAVPSRSNSSSNSVSRGMAGRASGGAAAGASAAVTVTAQSQAARKGYSFTPTTPSASFDMPTPSRRQRRASPWSSNGGYH